MTIVDVHHHWMPKEHLENIGNYLRVGERIVKDKDGIKVFRENIPVFRPDKKKYRIFSIIWGNSTNVYS